MPPQRWSRVSRPLRNPGVVPGCKAHSDSRPALKVALSINTSVKSFKDVKK